QAEDGIRDRNVTGVQTCALPIYGRILAKEDMGSKQIIHILWRLHKSRPLVNQLLQLNYKIENPYDLLVDWERNAPRQIRENTYRSEERRVGKEGRTRWSPDV